MASPNVRLVTEARLDADSFKREFNLMPRYRGTLTGRSLDDMVTLDDFGDWNVASNDSSVGGLPEQFTPGGAYSSAGAVNISGSPIAVIQRVTSRWPSVMWERVCVDTVGKRFTKWKVVTGQSSRLKGVADRDGWWALYDPSDESSTTIDADSHRCAIIRDLMGHMPSLVADPNSGPSAFPAYRDGYFGSMSALDMEGSSMVATGSALIPQPLTVMIVAENLTQVAAQQSVFGGDHETNRLQGGLNSSKLGYIGTSELIRSGEPVKPGVHVWEWCFDKTQSTVSVDGQLVWRGLPSSQTMGLQNFRLGGARRNAGSLSFEWRGHIGAVAIRKGIDRAANNRMRRAMKQQAGIPDGLPNFGKQVRAIDIDSRGRDNVVWGDPDLVVDGTNASTTKVLNALVARKYITDTMLNNTVTVIADDEFIPNPPNLADGDVITYRELFHSMLIPSNNTAPRTIARTVGALISSTGNPTENFVAAMNQHLADRGFRGANVETNPGGGLRCSPRQLILLFQELLEDDFLRECVSSASYTVTISGPNARTVDLTNTFHLGDYGRPNEWVASKDGTGTQASCSVFQWTHHDGTVHTACVMGLENGVDSRYIETLKLIEAGRNDQTTFSRHIPTGGFYYFGGPIEGSWGPAD